MDLPEMCRTLDSINSKIIQDIVFSDYDDDDDGHIINDKLSGIVMKNSLEHNNEHEDKSQHYTITLPIDFKILIDRFIQSINQHVRISYHIINMTNLLFLIGRFNS